jgi:hypothetical protein
MSHPMEKVYLLQHVHELSGVDDVKTIGVFRSESDAREAIRLLKRKPGFALHVEGFSIDEYELNRCFWQDGFDTV